MSERVTIASIGGAFGVHGEVRIKSFCSEPEAVADYAPLYTPEGRSFAGMVLTGRLKKGFSARIDGIVTKEEADAVRNTLLEVDRDLLPSLPDDEFYHADLMGLEVLDTGGTVIGRVKLVQNHGADDLLEVILSGGSDTVLIPFTKAAVPTVDLSAGRIIVDPPEGILD